LALPQSEMKKRANCLLLLYGLWRHSFYYCLKRPCKAEIRGTSFPTRFLKRGKKAHADSMNDAINTEIRLARKIPILLSKRAVSAPIDTTSITHKTSGQNSTTRRSAIL